MSVALAHAPPLSAALREETRAAHLEAERVFVRAVKEAGREDAGPLYLMHLNEALVRWLADEAHALPPTPIRDEIADFLATIDAARPAATVAPLLVPIPLGPALDGPQEIVGAAYAVCGSFLGAAALGRGWSAAAVPGFAAFCAASRRLEGRWPGFQQALDAFGDAPDTSRATSRAHMRAGAERAFGYARLVVASHADAERARRTA